jgi:hypothetical protein
LSHTGKDFYNENKGREKKNIKKKNNPLDCYTSLNKIKKDILKHQGRKKALTLHQVLYLIINDFEYQVIVVLLMDLSDKKENLVVHYHLILLL